MAGHRCQYGACTLNARYLGYKHTLQACNIYCFSTATMVTPVLRYTYIAVILATERVSVKRAQLYVDWI